MASISFANESLVDPRIQVKLDCGNIISQTSYTGSETDAVISFKRIKNKPNMTKNGKLESIEKRAQPIGLR